MKNTKKSLRMIALGVHKMVIENHILKLLFLKSCLLTLIALGFGISWYLDIGIFSSTYATNDVHEVNICHIPQGNAENMQTITVDENSVNYISHLSHGDYTGECIVPIQPICGNNIIEPSEACDDGLSNGLPGYCNTSCTSTTPVVPICGNAIIETGEQCDLGTGNGQNKGCSTSCVIEAIQPVCGNAAVEGSEQCDDGNLVSGDGCTSSCTIESSGGSFCGNSILETGEICDDGLLNGLLGYCNTSCTSTTPVVPVCGNTVLEVGEQCDLGTGNGQNRGCSTSCTIESIQPVCGNTILEAGEECDDGNLVGGDGCTSSCILEHASTPVCGNATLEIGEQCDDGNLVSGDGCTSSCTIEHASAPVCGNTILETGEQCDDGNLIDGDGCTLSCTVENPSESICGNTVLEAGEECDDGNTLNGDACSNLCILETPDGTLLAIPNAGQRPFDTTFSATKTSRAKYVSFDLGDGSSLIENPSFPTPHTYTTLGTYTGTLIIKNNYQGAIAPGVALPQIELHETITVTSRPVVCGNGNLEAGEECDDGNILNGDACNNLCTLEIPDGDLLATPNAGQRPFDTTFIASKDSRAKYVSLDLGDGSPLVSTPLFPESYTYTTPGLFTSRVTIKNNYQGAIASWAILPEVTFQTNVFSSETALYCGDGHLNGTEQCDDRNITERDGCSSTCILETPEAKIISTPPYGEQPLTATFTATKDSRAKYISLNYGDGTPISTNPIFPISHIYPNLGEYIITLIVKNNYTGQIAYGTTLPSIQVHTEDTIAVTLCGNEIKERGEQCDLGGGNGLNLGCTNQCKREIPAANCTVTADQTVVIFAQPVTFTITDVYTGWMSLYSLDFGDHNILMPGSGLENNQMIYVHSYNIGNNTFRSYRPTIYVRNDVAYTAGDLVVGSCAQNIVSIGQDYSWLPMSSVVVNTGHSAISTITGDVSVAAMLFPNYIFNTSQIFVLDGSQPLTTIYNPGQILLSDGTVLNVDGGVVIGDTIVDPQWIIKVGALDQGGFTFDVRASSGAAWMQQNTYILGPSGRGGEVKPPVQTLNTLQFGGTDTPLLFTKPVQLIIEGFVANEVNPPKYKSEGQTERHDIITVCNTPYDVEPTNIVLFGTPQECYQTNDKNTMIWTFHSTEFMVPILSDIHLLGKKLIKDIQSSLHL